MGKDLFSPFARKSMVGRAAVVLILGKPKGSKLHCCTASLLYFLAAVSFMFHSFLFWIQRASENVQTQNVSRSCSAQSVRLCGGCR